ncbi:hypothetical protein NADFUDRAFT_83263 [Nadsonia fulvescens var. elongata DSM 6958]|uniref:FAD-binding FR-type domain-containing protein n=1 Tax=Nadsonia fulvescens var. elongata DSM 6958 TaxID=857566 RepID=A0A1E3PIN1_9ASCO|nr:hypothetical protein NADFUDRAFT_83263 [Nadsonia fulvescens var. elongata DSM 6958]
MKTFNNSLRLICWAFAVFSLVEAKSSPRVILNNNGLVVGKSCLNYTLDWDFGCGLALATNSMHGSKANYDCLCANQPFIGTFSTCAYDNSQSDYELKTALNFFVTTCQDKSVSTPMDKDILKKSYENATEYMIDYTDVQLMGVGDNIMRSPVNVPITVNYTYYHLFYDMQNEFRYQVDSGTYYGLALVVYFLLIIFIGVVTNYLKITVIPFLINSTGKKTNLIRHYVTLPPAFRKRHSKPGNVGPFIWLIPTRVHSVVIAIYLILNIIFTCVDYRVVKPNAFFYYQTTYMQICRMLADRTGIICFTQIPLLFLFGGRNNFLMWVTGWSFDTFNAYHRWIARAAMFHAFVHSIGYSMWCSRKGSYNSNLHDVYFLAGVIATVFCGALWIQSFAIFRRHTYELFLVVHILLAIGFLVTIWYHCVDLGWMGYVYCSIAIWAFDRLARLVRIAWGGLIIKSKFQMYSNGTFRVDLPVQSRWGYYPGCHIYLYVLNSKKFWQSHPFTVFKTPENESNGTISLVVKPMKGITADIATFLSSQPENKGEIKTMVEGPYGYSHPINRYQTAVFISGGIGVTTNYPYAADLIKSNNHTQKIIFIWIIHDDQPLEWFKEELDHLSSSKNVEIRIFITSRHTKSTDQSDSSSLRSFSKLKESSYSRIVRGSRPHINEELLDIVSASMGTIGVIACGPPSLNDTVRLGVIEALDSSSNRIDYFEEAFSW